VSINFVDQANAANHYTAPPGYNKSLFRQLVTASDRQKTEYTMKLHATIQLLMNAIPVSQQLYIAILRVNG